MLLFERTYTDSKHSMPTSYLKHAKNTFLFFSKENKKSDSRLRVEHIMRTHKTVALANELRFYAERETFTLALVPNACQLFNYTLNCPLFVSLDRCAQIFCTIFQHILTYSTFHSSYQRFFFSFQIFVDKSKLYSREITFCFIMQSKKWIKANAQRKHFQLCAENEGNHKIELSIWRGHDFVVLVHWSFVHRVFLSSSSSTY